MYLYGYQRRFAQDASPFRIYNKSRQIGISFLSVLESIRTASTARADVLYASSSLRQSKEANRKARQMIHAFNETGLLGVPIHVKTASKEEIALKNGRKMLFLPSNPSTVRGFSGDVYLDEFALHKDQRKIYQALLPTVTRGYRLTIISTPMGQNDLFYEIFSQKENYPDFSRHQTTIYDALKEGLPVDAELLRRNTDEETFRQEFLCEFIDEATAFFPYTLIRSCVGEEITELQGENFLGIDVGRHKDLTVMTVMSAIGKRFCFKRTEILKNCDFRTQRETALQIIKEERVRAGCIDATGIGSQLSEEIAKEHATIQPVHFTAALKESIVLHTKKLFEEKNIEIPDNRNLIADIHSIVKTVTPSGNIRFDATRNEQGHADRFWALALALHAGRSPQQRISYEAIGENNSFRSALKGRNSFLI